MTHPKFRALRLVVHLVTSFKMALRDACRAAGHREGVDPDWLYRELTR